LPAEASEAPAGQTRDPPDRPVSFATIRAPLQALDLRAGEDDAVGDGVDEVRTEQRGGVPLRQVGSGRLPQTQPHGVPIIRVVEVCRVDDAGARLQADWLEG